MLNNENGISTTAVESTESTETTIFGNPEQLKNLLEQSTKLDELKPVVQLTAEYMELAKPGESFRGIFIGFQKINVTDKATGESLEKEAVRFIVDKVVKLNAGISLVREFKGANVPTGTTCEVTYMKKEGNLKIYAVTVLA
jgi:hypothetical protein